MSQTEAKRPTGVVWFVLGGIGLLIALLQLLTVAGAADAATAGGKTVGMILFGIVGVALIVIGVRKRR